MSQPNPPRPLEISRSCRTRARVPASPRRRKCSGGSSRDGLARAKGMNGMINYLLWTDGILSHHFETMVETFVGWYLLRNHHPRLSERWCRNAFMHSSLNQARNRREASRFLPEAPGCLSKPCRPCGGGGLFTHQLAIMLTDMDSQVSCSIALKHHAAKGA